MLLYLFLSVVGHSPETDKNFGCKGSYNLLFLVYILCLSLISSCLLIPKHFLQALLNFGVINLNHYLCKAVVKVMEDE